MAKNLKKDAFTLLEVMIAVVIISVVIMALLQMNGNRAHMFLEISKKNKINQYSSLLLFNPNYGFENKRIFLDRLVADFKIEDELRNKLKSINAQIIYQKLGSIEMGKQQNTDAEIVDNKNVKHVNSNVVFEISKTILKTPQSSIGLLRIRIQ